MKITQKYLRKLILETIEEIYVPGKETDTFIDPKTGKVTATAPKYSTRPKIKYETSDEEFLSALAPVVSFSQERNNVEEGIQLRDLIYFIFQRLDTKNTKRLAADFNAEFEKTGAKFSADTMTDILDILRAEKNIKATSDVIKRLETIGAEGRVSKYIPDKDFEPPFKTANYRAPVKPPEKDQEKTEPDFTPPELKENKILVKYR